MVTTALKMALWRRDHADRSVASGLIHHSDAGSLGSTRPSPSPNLVLEGTASIGSIGDAYDNALAETTIGLFKTEAVGRGSHSWLDRCASSTTSNTRRWNGSTRSTTADCTAASTTSRPRNRKRPTTLKPRSPSRRRLNHEAGIKLETVQFATM